MTEPSTETGSFPVIKKNSDIVVGIDGSKGSCCALAWAMQEASLTGQYVVCLWGGRALGTRVVYLKVK